MNWEAIGAIGEIVGAAAVVATLIILLFQVRHSTQVMEESNKLELASALDRHSDSVGAWRGRMVENADLMRIWVAAQNDEAMDAIDYMRFSFQWIDFTNTQRSNFMRAKTVGAPGLGRQAVLSLAVIANQSDHMMREWKVNRAWHELESSEFVQLVDEAIVELKSATTTRFHTPGALFDLDGDPD